MARYASVDDLGNGTNVVEWDGETGWMPPPGVQSIIDTNGNVSPGWTYANGQFVAPPQPPPPPPQPVTSVTALAFRQLFTPAERVAVTKAGFTDANVRVFIDDAAAAGTVDLTATETQQGMMYLQKLGLITGPRAAAILAAQPPS